MNKKKIRILLLLLCVCIGVMAGYFKINTSAKEGRVVDSNLEASYTYGDSFTIPDGKVSFKGEIKEAEGKYLVFPSGKANEAKKIALSEYGEYQVVYTARFNGIKVSAETSFIVNEPIAVVKSDISTVTIEGGIIKTDLAPNDVLTYNRVVDLSDNSLDIPLLGMMADPITTGMADATSVVIQLTDLYNEENYVRLTIKNIPVDWCDGQVYITAGSKTQPQVGVADLDHPDKTKIHTNNKYGTPFYFSLVGLPKSDMDTELRIYYNHEEKAFYADREIYSGGQIRLIADLDDPQYYGAELWEGFSSDQVKMTVYAENYQASSCNFSLTQIDGETGFVAEGDSTIPTIRVESEYDMDKLPHALVGTPYTIFGANAVDDFDGQIATSAEVYYKYFSATPVKVTVADGKFTPNKEGTYSIVYTATDKAGNVATEVVKVNAVTGDGLKVSLEGAAKETNTGESVKVVSNISYTNHSGNVSFKVTAKNASTGEKKKIDASSLEFCPMSDGDWEITIAVKDYLSTVKETFMLKSNHTSQPQIYDKVGVQTYFILGATYELPSVPGYDFSSGKGVKKEAQVFVTENGKAEKALKNGQYVPETIGAVTITYRMTVDNLTCERTYNATVLDVGYTDKLSLDKYFHVVNGNIIAEKSNINTTYRAVRDAKMEFINFVEVEKFSFSFRVGDQNNYNLINVYLTDTVTGKQVKLTYKRSGSASLFSINDGAELTVDSGFEGMNRAFLLEFKNASHVAYASTAVNQTVKTWLDGSEFTGFTNSVAIMSVELAEVSGMSQLIVDKLNAQSINNSTEDRSAPELVVETKSGDRTKGDKVVLKGAFVYDTLDPISKLTMTVTDPDGKHVKDTDGVVLDGSQDPTKDYEIKFTKYGDYTLTYIAVDGGGRSEEYTYVITSKDVTGPTITLKKHKTTAGLNTEVKIAEIEVKDNITEKCNTVVYVFNPQDVCEQVKNGAFTPTKKGTYTVRYMVSDDNGNYAFASYEIEVK